MTVLTEVGAFVFIGRTNPVTVVAVDTYDPSDGTLTPVSWSGIARMIMTLTRRRDQTIETVDSVADAGTIDFGTDGQVSFTLGVLAESRPIAPGIYDAELVSVDGSDVETEVASPRHPTHRLAFEFLPGAVVV